MTINLIEPGSLYGDRINQLDFRFAKIFRFGGKRAMVALDLYNALNANPVLTYNNTFVPGGTVAAGELDPDREAGANQRRVDVLTVRRVYKARPALRCHILRLRRGSEQPRRLRRMDQRQRVSVLAHAGTLTKR